MIGIEIFNRIADGEDGTLSTVTDRLPDSGYFVGGCGQALVYGSLEHANRSIALTEIIAFVEECKAPFVGWWTDSEDGRVYIDGTSWYADYDKAEQACRDRGEVAFWSITDQREFRPVALADKEV